MYGDWTRHPVKPTLDSEPCYEDIDVSLSPGNGRVTPYDVRRRAYRSVFSGGCGVTYGHTSVWQMYDRTRDPMFGADTPWQECLDAPAATQMHHLKELMLSRPFLTRVPDQSLILPGSSATSARATRDEHGSYALVYLPYGSESVRIDLRRLTGFTFRAQRFNPRTGEYSEIGSYAREDEPVIKSGWKGPDWVIVIDRADGA